MKTQLVVDAACDLPPQFLQQRDIAVLPINVDVDGTSFIDSRQQKIQVELYHGDQLSLKHDVQSRPLTADETADFFMKKIVPQCKYALMQTTSNKRSPIFSNCEAAQKQILKLSRDMREAGQLDGPFGMRVMNGGTMFTGQGLLAAFTSDLIRAEKSTSDILRLANAFKNRIYAYVVPADVAYIRERARKRGEDSISMMAALFAKSLDIKPIVQMHLDESEPVAKERGFENACNSLFDYACRRIRTGLLSPYIVISVAGDPDELNNYDSYKELMVLAKKEKVTLLTTIMGLAGGLNLGKGSISIALACEAHDFAD